MEPTSARLIQNHSTQSTNKPLNINVRSFLRINFARKIKEIATSFRSEFKPDPHSPNYDRLLFLAISLKEFCKKLEKQNNNLKYRHFRKENILNPPRLKMGCVFKKFLSEIQNNRDSGSHNNKKILKAFLYTLKCPLEMLKYQNALMGSKNGYNNPQHFNIMPRQPRRYSSISHANCAGNIEEIASSFASKLESNANLSDSDLLVLAQRLEVAYKKFKKHSENTRYTESFKYLIAKAKNLKINLNLPRLAAPTKFKKLFEAIEKKGLQPDDYLEGVKTAFLAVRVCTTTLQENHRCLISLNENGFFESEKLDCKSIVMID